MTVDVSEASQEKNSKQKLKSKSVSLVPAAYNTLRMSASAASRRKIQLQYMYQKINGKYVRLVHATYNSRTMSASAANRRKM